MIIAHNISALNTYKSLGIASGAANKSMEKLSSGYRINRAGDDAAGLSISEKMRSQIRGLNRASRNAQDGISMIQTAEGALNEEHSILQRMREIAVQSATDTNQDLDRQALQNEMAQLSSEINRIGNTTEFNGMKLLDGTKKISYNDDAVQASVTAGGIKLKAVKGGAADGKAGNDYSLKIVEDDSIEGDAVASISGKEITITLKDLDSATGTTKDKVNAAIAANTSLNGLVEVDTLSNGGASAVGTAAKLENGTDATVDKDNSVYFHVGANSNQTISTEFGDMRAVALGITTKTANTAGFATTENVTSGLTNDASEFSLDISTREGANTAIGIIDSAINTVSQERSKYGAIQNRLEYTINNLNTTAENMQAAESRIRDVDMADEMMQLTKNNILQQAAQAMLVQANQRPQQALQLLQ